MISKSLNVLAAALALGLLAGCTTPCEAPGRLCAPEQANTSAQPALPAPQAVPVQPAEAPAAQPATVRIALLIPPQSEKLGLPAAALRDGFLAAWERDRAGFSVEVVTANDEDDYALLEAYTMAAARSDVVVGPLPRPAVGLVATSRAVRKPTIALSQPGHGVNLPPQMLAIGLSVEAEARQAADWAAAEHPAGSALVLAGPEPWQQRVAHAFAARWAELGRSSHTTNLNSNGGYVDAAAVDSLRGRVETDPPEVLFAALDADELRQVRTALGSSIACYAASPANPGQEPGQAVPELDGVRLVDLPWEVQRDHPAVMVYPRWLGASEALELDRLYALGIDAFRVARQIALHPDQPVELDGVTGRLSLQSSHDGASFKRREAAAVYRNGLFEPVLDAN
jgi:outer membrane PBP1 activator LpoA protein